jgi:hypothetical protein
MQINSLIAASIDIYLRNTKYPLKEYGLRLIATTVPVTLDRRYRTNYQPAGHRDYRTSENTRARRPLPGDGGFSLCYWN